MSFDFALVLVVLTVLSGFIWACDSWLLAPRRRAAAKAPGADAGAGRAAAFAREPVLVEYARSFFPIFLIVLLLRSFLVEPFRIPSGSMMPTLLIGDFVLVNKYLYGLRLPVINKKVVELATPRRGDVVVFRYPARPSVPFIKRVVGLPGDRIAYRDKVLYVNGTPVSQEPAGTYVGVGAGRDQTGDLVLWESLGGVEHQILIDPDKPSLQEGEIVVPAGHYFVMGDNRDNSMDSRFWGTVPDENLIGKAFIIWMNWDSENGGVDWKRIGRRIR